MVCAFRNLIGTRKSKSCLNTSGDLSQHVFETYMHLFIQPHHGSRLHCTRNTSQIDFVQCRLCSFQRKVHGQDDKLRFVCFDTSLCYAGWVELYYYYYRIKIKNVDCCRIRFRIRQIAILIYDELYYIQLVSILIPNVSTLTLCVLKYKRAN